MLQAQHTIKINILYAIVDLTNDAKATPYLADPPSRALSAISAIPLNLSRKSGFEFGCLPFVENITAGRRFTKNGLSFE
jgi:hypothetical protein